MPQRGIFVDVSSLLYSDYAVQLGISTAYSQMHFTLSNVTFENNYCSNYFIHYLMKKNVHNILIKNVTAQNSIVGTNGMIIIENAGDLANSDTTGQNLQVAVNGHKVQFYVPPRYMNITNLLINGAYCGDVIFNIAHMPLVYIDGLEILNAKDGASTYINTIIRSYSSSGRYLSKNLTDAETPSLSCSTITSFTSNYQLTLSNIQIINTQCLANLGLGGLYIENLATSSAYLSNILLANLTGNSADALALYIESISSVSIKNISLYNITKEKYVFLYLHKV